MVAWFHLILIDGFILSYFAFLAEHGTTLLLGTVTTIKVLVCSIILYVIISMIFGLMRLSKNPIVQGTATVYIEFFRGTSLLVQLFWFYYVLPFFGISLGAFTAGVVAIGMNFGAYGAETLNTMLRVFSTPARIGWVSG